MNDLTPIFTEEFKIKLSSINQNSIYLHRLIVQRQNAVDKYNCKPNSINPFAQQHLMDLVENDIRQVFIDLNNGINEMKYYIDANAQAII